MKNVYQQRKLLINSLHYFVNFIHGIASLYHLVLNGTVQQIASDLTGEIINRYAFNTVRQRKLLIDSSLLISHYFVERNKQHHRKALPN